MFLAFGLGAALLAQNAAGILSNGEFSVSHPLNHYQKAPGWGLFGSGGEDVRFEIISSHVTKTHKPFVISG